MWIGTVALLCKVPGGCWIFRCMAGSNFLTAVVSCCIRRAGTVVSL